MTAAERLRNALDDPGFYVGEASMEGPTDAWDVITAAASERLAQLETDPELVERIADVLSGIEVTPSQHHPSEMIDWARSVLVAITTPTPGAE